MAAANIALRRGEERRGKVKVQCGRSGDSATPPRVRWPMPRPRNGRAAWTRSAPAPHQEMPRTDHRRHNPRGRSSREPRSFCLNKAAVVQAGGKELGTGHRGRDVGAS
jgi:hypothetical protein